MPKTRGEQGEAWLISWNLDGMVLPISYGSHCMDGNGIGNRTE